MLGYWVEDVPVRVDSPGLKSTLYLLEDRALLAIGSWSDMDEQATLIIDWEALGWDPGQVTLQAPGIRDLQSQQEIALGGPFVVPAGEGIILELRRGK